MRYKSKRLLIILASLALASFVVLLSRRGGAELPYWGVHTVMALGILPLIFAVMTYFVPVLTRTGVEDKRVMWLPPLALAGGGLTVSGMAGVTAEVQAGALLTLIAAFVLLGWMHRRRVQSLGAPHPGLAWYEAALGFLLLGLVAILAGTVWPEHWTWLRRLHVHFNLLGFVGLTAIGTLQVLLPTAGGYLDPASAQRLRAGLKYAVAGTLLIGAGAAWLPWLAWLGLLVWMIPLSQFSLATLRRFTQMRRGAATALSSALLGFVLVLFSGGLHSLGMLAPRLSVTLFFLIFLLPLVTGAVSYLLPLWWQPGAGQVETLRVRTVLERGSLLRAWVFPACGGLLLAGVGWAVYPAVAVLVVFIGQILWVVLRGHRSGDTKQPMTEAAHDPRAAKAGRFRQWRIYIVEVLLFILLLAGVHAWQTRDLPTGPAMALEGTLLDGRNASLSVLRGRPVLVHFWATWCPVCKLEQDNINAIAQDHQVFSIAMQSGTDKEVRDHMTQNHLAFPAINDADGALSRRWGIRGVPTSFILDGTGHIRFVEVGYTTEAGLRLRLALAGAGSAHTTTE